MVQTLIEHRALIDAANIELATPLMAAIQGGHADTAWLLLQNRANADAETKLGDTALTSAVMTTDCNVAQHLMEELLLANASVDLPRLDGQTALMLAVQRSSLELAERLLNAGAAVNMLDNKGRTPLSVARGAEIAHKLIYAGASANVSDNVGAAPLILAAARLSEEERQALQHDTGIEEVRRRRRRTQKLAGDGGSSNASDNRRCEDIRRRRNVFSALAIMRLLGSAGASLDTGVQRWLAEIETMISVANIASDFAALSFPWYVWAVLHRGERVANICDAAFTCVAHLAEFLLFCICIVPVSIIWIVVLVVAIVYVRCAVNVRQHSMPVCDVCWANECQRSRTQARDEAQRVASDAGIAAWRDELYPASSSSLYLDPDNVSLDDKVNYDIFSRLGDSNVFWDQHMSQQSKSSAMQQGEYGTVPPFLLPFLLFSLPCPSFPDGLHQICKHCLRGWGFPLMLFTAHA